MPQFSYNARDRYGRPTQGNAEALDLEDLRKQLRKEDVFLTSARVTQSEGKAAGGGASLFGGGVKLQDLVIMTRQLATLIRSGVPLVQGLEIVRDQTNKPALRDAVSDVQLGVVGGENMSAMMRKHPKVFDELIVALVEAGETSGTLDHTLEVASDQLDRIDELKRKVSAATTYPKIVIGAAAGTVAIMLLAVVPVFSKVYKELRSPLPPITESLIKVSDFCVTYWWIVLLAFIGLVFAYRWYYRTPSGRYNLDKLSLRLPIFGPIFRKIAIARVVQTLGGAVHAGVPIIRAMEIASSTAGNRIISEAVDTVTLRIKEGASIGTELQQTGEFPLMVTRMIESGEASGNLDQMLDEINRFYERDVAYAVDKMTKVIEPFLTVVVGGIVLFVLLALYSPIFNLGQAFTDSEKKTAPTE